MENKIIILIAVLCLISGVTITLGVKQAITEDYYRNQYDATRNFRCSVKSDRANETIDNNYIKNCKEGQPIICRVC